MILIATFYILPDSCDSNVPTVRIRSHVLHWLTGVQLQRRAARYYHCVHEMYLLVFSCN